MDTVFKEPDVWCIDFRGDSCEWDRLCTCSANLDEWSGSYKNYVDLIYWKRNFGYEVKCES